MRVRMSAASVSELWIIEPRYLKWSVHETKRLFPRVMSALSASVDSLIVVAFFLPSGRIRFPAGKCMNSVFDSFSPFFSYLPRWTSSPKARKWSTMHFVPSIRSSLVRKIKAASSANSELYWSMGLMVSVLVALSRFEMWPVGVPSAELS